MELMTDAQRLGLQARRAAVRQAAEDVRNQADGIERDTADCEAERWLRKSAYELLQILTYLDDERMSVVRVIRSIAQTADQQIHFALDRLLLDEIDAAENAPTVVDQTLQLLDSIIEQCDQIESRTAEA